MRNFAQKEQKLRTLCHPSQRSLVKRRPLARDLIGPNLAQYLMLGAADLKKTTVLQIYYEAKIIGPLVARYLKNMTFPQIENASCSRNGRFIF